VESPTSTRCGKPFQGSGGLAKELFAVLLHHVAPQVDVMSAGGSGHARWLEDPAVMTWNMSPQTAI
jgi:hypothetical protein